MRKVISIVLLGTLSGALYAFGGGGGSSPSPWTTGEPGFNRMYGEQPAWGGSWPQAPQPPWSGNAQPLPQASEQEQSAPQGRAPGASPFGGGWGAPPDFGPPWGGMGNQYNPSPESSGNPPVGWGAGPSAGQQPHSSAPAGYGRWPGQRGGRPGMRRRQGAMGMGNRNRERRPTFGGMPGWTGAPSAGSAQRSARSKEQTSGLPSLPAFPPMPGFPGMPAGDYHYPMPGYGGYPGTGRSAYQPDTTPAYPQSKSFQDDKDLGYPPPGMGYPNWFPEGYDSTPGGSGGFPAGNAPPPGGRYGNYPGSGGSSIPYNSPSGTPGSGTRMPPPKGMPDQGSSVWPEQESGNFASYPASPGGGYAPPALPDWPRQGDGYHAARPSSGNAGEDFAAPSPASNAAASSSSIPPWPTMPAQADHRPGYGPAFFEISSGEPQGAPSAKSSAAISSGSSDNLANSEHVPQ